MRPYEKIFRGTCNTRTLHDESADMRLEMRLDRGGEVFEVGQRRQNYTMAGGPTEKSNATVFAVGGRWWNVVLSDELAYKCCKICAGGFDKSRLKVV